MSPCTASLLSILMVLRPPNVGKSFLRQVSQIMFPDLGRLMIYSYPQISAYLACPRRYRYRYLDGWKEKDTRAAMLFGRAFETALSAFFRREDSAAILFREWSNCRDQARDLRYSKGDTWDRMLEQGIQLLHRFCQDDRVQVGQPQRNLQVKFTRSIPK